MFICVHRNYSVTFCLIFTTECITP